MAGVISTRFAEHAEEALLFAGGGEADEIEGLFGVILLLVAAGVFEFVRVGDCGELPALSHCVTIKDCINMDKLRIIKFLAN